MGMNNAQVASTTSACLRKERLMLNSLSDRRAARLVVAKTFRAASDEKNCAILPHDAALRQQHRESCPSPHNASAARRERMSIAYTKSALRWSVQHDR